MINFILSPLISDVIKKTTRAHTMNGSPCGGERGGGDDDDEDGSNGGPGGVGGEAIPIKEETSLNADGCGSANPGQR